MDAYGGDDEGGTHRNIRRPFSDRRPLRPPSPHAATRAASSSRAFRVRVRAVGGDGGLHGSFDEVASPPFAFVALTTSSSSSGGGVEVTPTPNLAPSFVKRMLKTGSASRGGGATRSNPNPSAAVAEPDPKVSSRVLSSNASGKKRPESASTSAPPQKSKEAKQPDAKPAPELSETGSEETDLSTSEGDDSSWISWFCGLRGNELLCEVDEDYIQDDFNLCGLQVQVPYYDYALDMILDNDSLSGEVDGEEHSEIESAAELLYGLIHARYILTSKGLNAMHEKYKRADFGRCPRVFCGGQPCLPMGTSDIPRNGSVKIYCPRCEDLYLPRCKYQSSMDGSYIGTTFPHLYLMTYPSAKPARPGQHYVPRVFGFKLHKSSR